MYLSIRPSVRPPARPSACQMSQPAPNLGPLSARQGNAIRMAFIGPILRAYLGPAYKVCVKDGRLDKPHGARIKY